MKGPWGQAEFERVAKRWLGFTTGQGEISRGCFPTIGFDQRNIISGC